MPARHLNDHGGHAPEHLLYLEEKRPMNHKQTKEKHDSKKHQAPTLPHDWARMKENAKKIWGQLTEDDFSKANGSVESLCNIIQERFGDAQEEAQSKLHKLSDDAKDADLTKPTSEVADAVNEGIGWAQKRFNVLGVRIDKLLISNRKKWGVFKLDMNAAFGAIGNAFKKLAG
jgi:uncharacterized protein YjbJ (UPF0337 family)